MMCELMYPTVLIDAHAIGLLESARDLHRLNISVSSRIPQLINVNTDLQESDLVSS